MTEDKKINYDDIFESMISAELSKIVFTQDISNKETDSGNTGDIDVTCKAEFYKGDKIVGNRIVTENIKNLKDWK